MPIRRMARLRELCDVVLPHAEHLAHAAAGHDEGRSMERRQAPRDRTHALGGQGIGGDQAGERVGLAEAAHLDGVLDGRASVLARQLESRGGPDDGAHAEI